jgi:hypothetical protein
MNHLGVNDHDVAQDLFPQRGFEPVPDVGGWGHGEDASVTRVSTARIAADVHLVRGDGVVEDDRSVEGMGRRSRMASR